MKEYKLPKEFATKWVEALRENKIPQIHSEFRAVIDGQDCFCANGLAYFANGYEFDGKLSSQVLVDGRKRSMWNSDEFLPLSYIIVIEIMTLNDDKRKTFPEIADWIEQNVEFV